jgi:SAM-dependent methyltransferase
MTATTLQVQTSVDYFESIYAEAEGDASRIRWADGRPHPALVTWLNAVAPSLVRCGSRVCTVGCGLGDDARELMSRGYDVTAFDCSRTAIEWARRIDPANSRCYFEADLFQTPARWRHRFDLVVEINTIQSLSPDLHLASMSAIADLVSPKGHLLVICRGAESPVSSDEGPPWPLTQPQLLEAAALSNLTPVEPATLFMDDEDPPVLRMRAFFRRGGEMIRESR